MVHKKRPVRSVQERGSGEGVQAMNNVASRFLAGVVNRSAGALRHWHGLVDHALSRAHLAFVHDVIMAAAAFTAAVSLTMGFARVFSAPVEVFWNAVLYGIAAAVSFKVTKLYRSLWYYVSLTEMMCIIKSVTLCTAVFLPIYLLSPTLSHYPIHTVIAAWFVLSGFLSGPRVAFRIVRRRYNAASDQDEPHKEPLLLVGAGDGSELFLRAMLQSSNPPYKVVGILDEMGNFLRRSIHGIEVLGTMSDLAKTVELLDRRGVRPTRLVVTEDRLSPVALRSLLDEAESLGLKLSRIPRLTEFRNGASDGIEVQSIAIEDLLGRPQAALDRASMRAMCEGARVLVTGAGGTIGSELVRQIAQFRPAHIALLDNSEYLLYQTDLELSERHREQSRSAVMADVRDRARIFEVMRAQKPDLVFHAAAMKHVPMVEMNPAEGILTNVHGTRNVADASIAFGARAMVLISTDKAVNPTNIMGATKRIAESYCQALDVLPADGKHIKTRFVTVRFGNVLGSTGSVVPLFRRQLQSGGPLTVTHPHVTRYFMTTHEAVELVLQASALGCASEDNNGMIFVLDMGDPVRIQDLARQMIRLAGLRVGRDIDIVYTGLRPGEKLYEEPLHISEELRPTDVGGILLASPRIADHSLISRAIDEMVLSATQKDAERAIGVVQRLVPEYRPTENKDGGIDPNDAGVDQRPLATVTDIRKAFREGMAS